MERPEVAEDRLAACRVGCLHFDEVRQRDLAIDVANLLPRRSRVKDLLVLSTARHVGLQAIAPLEQRAIAARSRRVRARCHVVDDETAGSGIGGRQPRAQPVEEGEDVRVAVVGSPKERVEEAVFGEIEIPVGRRRVPPR